MNPRQPLLVSAKLGSGFWPSRCVPSWQPMQYLSRTGWTSRLKENPRTGPRHGSMSLGGLDAAIVGLWRGVLFCCSWQPTQVATSPGIAVYHERMTCNARPLESRGCTASGVLAGTRKRAEPSS